MELPPPGFLARIGEAVGLRGPAGSAHYDALSGDAPPSVARDWVFVLEQMSRGAGLRACRIDGMGGHVLDALGPRRALATWHPEHGWVGLVTDGRARPRLIRGHARDEVIDRASFERRFGDVLDSPGCWIQIEPSLADASRGAGARPKPAARLLSLLRADRSDIATVVVYAVFAGLMTLATPIAVQQLVNSVAFGGLVQPVVVLAILLMAGLGFGALISALQAVAVELIQRRIFVRACADLADRLPRVDAGAVEGGFGPELVNRFFDLVTVQKTGASLLLAGTSLVLQTLVGLTILSFYHPLMLGFSVFLILAIAFVMGVLGRGATGTAIAESSAKYKLAAWMEELAREPGPFKTRSGRRWAAQRADDLAVSWIEARRQHFRIVLRQVVGSLVLQVVAGTAVLGIGGMLVVNGQLTLGQLVASEIIVAIVVAAVARLGKLLESYYDLLAAIDKFGTLLDLPLERIDGDAPSEGGGAAAIELREVVIDGPPGATATPRLSTRVAPGDRVALRGGNAAVRGELLRAIVGLSAPARGSIHYDGDELDALYLEALRESVMVVGEPELHTGTILDNLRVARPGAPRAAIDEALERVGLAEMIDSLPQGVRTRIEPSGWPLDAGAQRQLMLARAVLASPRVLCVDDALVHLDAESRIRALEVLTDPAAPWTLFLSSHEPTDLAACTHVFDLDTGELRASVNVVPDDTPRSVTG